MNFTQTAEILAFTLFRPQFRAGHSGICGGHFLRKHCVECHADGGDEGRFRLDPLLDRDHPAGNFEDTPACERILHQLSQGNMPPEEAEQPTADERQTVVAALETYLKSKIDDRGARYAGAFARRLNHEE